jgi:hypothetical protein
MAKKLGNYEIVRVGLFPTPAELTAAARHKTRLENAGYSLVAQYAREMHYRRNDAGTVSA